MTTKKQKGLSRRDFIMWSGSGALAVGAASGPFFLFPERAAAQQKPLKILQWSHFVPAYDTWFDGTFCKQWGQKHDTNVIIDHINLVDLAAKAASEASARKGHDLFMLLSPPAAYEKQTVDMGPVYQEVEKRHGKKIDLAHKSTYNPKTKRYFAFSDAYTPDPGNWHKDWWTEAGFLNGPDSWEDLRVGAKKIRDKSGHPCGLGLSQELDTSMAMRALLWSFGGAQQFLIDYIDAFHDGFLAGQFYNFPCFPSTVPNLKQEIANDPRANPPDKYKVLGDVLDWATNIGYPGYGTAAIDEAFKAWIIPTMFAKVARGDETPENAAKAAEEEYKRIFARWK